MTARFKLDLDKQEAVVRYIKMLEPGISRLKLRLVLYLSDLESYRKHGKPITGAVYRRGRKAPIVEGLSRTLKRIGND